MKYVIIILLICGIELSYSQVDKDNYLKTPNQNYNPANDDHYIYFKKNGILLENKNTHHKIILKEGTNVNIVCLDGKILQGKIYINSDSIISIEKVFFSIDSGTYIENENCSINNIFQIKRGVNLRSGGIGITKIGGVLEIIGIPMWILWKLEYSSALPSSNIIGTLVTIFIAERLIIIGLISTTIGVLMIYRYRYFKKEKWNMRIISI